MSTPTITAGSLPTSALLGYPCTSFQVNERRSLTVHLEDAGWFDVQCVDDPNDQDASHAYPVQVGRYRSFDDARAVANRLNAAWKCFPQSTAREVAAFGSRSIHFLTT